ncbi:MAG: hypothetical protein P8075_20135 [Deltaproteobacteria bacterium]
MNSRLGVTATTDMAVLPGVLRCRSLRRTVQVRFGTNPVLPRDGCQVARPSSWSRDSNSWNIRASRDRLPLEIFS